jgi:FkbM family methyltransferase
MQTHSIGETTPRLQTADLGLPEVRLMPTTYHDSDFYGASGVAAQYCGFSEPPTSPRGYWMHAWGPKQFLAFDSPILYFGPVDLKGKSDYHWVGRLDEKNLLRRHGYKNAEAIGLPIVYVPDQPVARRQGSLLVMPAHSSDDTTSDWKFEEYADEIARIRPSFSEVWICIHPSCWEHGYWVNVFKERGFPVVQGALYTDRNALERLYRLFSSFEYVTTNAIGSHVAYAAYLGAKVSFYGSYAEVGSANYNNVKEYESMMEHWEWARAETTVRQYYPELFCHPAEAKQRIDWGRYEVGFDKKVLPAQLRSLFGWTLGARLAQSAQAAAGTVSDKARECLRIAIPSRLRHRRRLRRDSNFHREWEHRQEVERLESVPRNTTTTTNLVGGCFELVDSKSFLTQYKAIFEQQIYRFESRKETPLIIDGGANVGLSVLYFKRSFPKSRIIAFEADPEIFQVLSKNCAAFQLENVELIPKALWTEETVVKFDRDGADAGRIVAQTNSLEAVDVCACRLKDYLDQEVDLLKLDLEGSELDVLVDCEDVLANVQKIVVEYHSFRDQPQKLHLLTQILNAAGFRLHVNSGLVSPQPLWWRQVSKSMDMRLYIYGFRP